jgi:hypothetical protein
MRIIGGKKDYYDYLVSYYGLDDCIVYDRRKIGEVNAKWTDRFLFYICGKIIPVIKKEKNFIFDPDSESLTNSWKDNFENKWMLKWINKPTKANAEFRQPVLCSTTFLNSDYFIPCLADFGFAGQIEAHEMYEKIYAFLGWLKDNPEPPNTRTNKDKIIAHGMCPRESFRPQIKTK